MQRLFHFSDVNEIDIFEPRPPLRHPGADSLVWAIDEWHSPLYFLPRECPRVAFWPLATTSADDIERWMIDPLARMIICVEAGWLGRIQDAPLFRYELPTETFVDCHDHGVHTSAVAVRPLGMDALDDLPGRILNARVELRFCQSLVPIGRAIQASSLHFSLIRMRNAAGWEGPAGTPVAPPEPRSDGVVE